MFVSFSGGRTSAFMAIWLKSQGHNIKCVFANTGLEHEKTLEFVHRCDQEYDLNITWLEADVKETGVGTGYKVVSYASASRDGEPFEQVIQKFGIPNQAYPHCNRELKLAPISLWRKHNGTNTACAIGIRVDEIDRMSATAEKMNLVYPLISMRPTAKPEIIDWWSRQNFDLEIPEHQGNCVTCWKKSNRKLLTLAKENPSSFDFFARMEKDHGFSGFRHEGDEEPRRFFRGKQTVADIIATSKKPFHEFVDHKPEYQLDMFGLDLHSGCSESCEAYTGD